MDPLRGIGWWITCFSEKCGLHTGDGAQPSRVLPSPHGAGLRSTGSSKRLPFPELSQALSPPRQMAPSHSGSVLVSSFGRAPVNPNAKGKASVGAAWLCGAAPVPEEALPGDGSAASRGERGKEAAPRGTRPGCLPPSSGRTAAAPSSRAQAHSCQSSSLRSLG